MFHKFRVTFLQYIWRQQSSRDIEAFQKNTNLNSQKGAGVSKDTVFERSHKYRNGGIARPLAQAEMSGPLTTAVEVLNILCATDHNNNLSCCYSPFYSPATGDLKFSGERSSHHRLCERSCNNSFRNSLICIDIFREKGCNWSRESIKQYISLPIFLKSLMQCQIFHKKKIVGRKCNFFSNYERKHCIHSTYQHTKVL